MDYAIVFDKTDAALKGQFEKTLDGIKVIFLDGADPGGIDGAVLQDTVIIFGNPDKALLARCPRLKWLQLLSAGANGYVSGELASGVMLTCATGGYGHAVSEHMVGLTFELLKKLHVYRDEQLKGVWKPRGAVKSIQGAVVVVVGLGDLGGNYAGRMKALGSYIIGVRRTEQPKPAYADEVVLSDHIDDALPRADVIALTVPGLKETTHLINRERIAKMKKGAVIINGGRGSAIDTEALCDALESGQLGGAGLDVTEPEPLPGGHRLWKIENAVITPHVAGGRNMPETGRYIMNLNLEKAARFMKGEKLKSLVDLQTGYSAG
jgi:phosphoglycerate dehydrogenase-like enzyme